MPRQNYMTVSVSDSVQAMFNEFVRVKDLSKTAALADVLEMYMLATDEALYWELKKKVLHVENHVYPRFRQSYLYSSMVRSSLNSRPSNVLTPSFIKIMSFVSGIS